MRAVRAVLAVALVAGCAGPVPLPEPVRVPVPVACVEELPEKPQLPTDAEILELPDYEVVVVLWLERAVRIVYQARLEAALAGCWQPESGGT